MKQQEAKYARWMLANYMPWHMAEPHEHLTIKAWDEYVTTLKTDACVLDGKRESDDDPDHAQKWRTRFVGASRLFEVENVHECFRVKQSNADVLMTHRARARDWWNEKNKPKAADGSDGIGMDALKKMEKMRKRAEEKAKLKPVWQRLEIAKKVAAETKKLQKSIASAQGDATSLTSSSGLRESWGLASRPTKRSVSGLFDGNGHAVDVEKVASSNKTALDRPATLHQSSTAAQGTTTNSNAAARADPLLFKAINEEEYEAAAHAWEAGGKVGPGPLNVQQRDGARDFFKAAEIRANGKLRDESPRTISQMIAKEGLSLVTLLMGAGGTGKSAVVHTLSAEISKLPKSTVIVTAFTGVAAAPFGGPTLLKLLKLGRGANTDNTVHKTVGLPEREKMRKQFFNQCGVKIEDVGGIVIDEISFVSDKVIGHLDMRLRDLLEAPDTFMGGMPVLLCGDNFQKHPPGVPGGWYTPLVNDAVGAKSSDGPNSAAAKGLYALGKAKLVELTRLMRAKDDGPFVTMQQDMRRTHVKTPVPSTLVDGMGVLSKSDVSNDQTWAFAPIGVVSRLERDALNHSQAEAFACAWGLPLVKWRLELNDIDDIEHAHRDEIYEHEPNLWGWFIEGAPVLLTDTIKATRKLVNGTPAIMDSLSFRAGIIPPELAAAYSTGGFSIVELSTKPISVNVRVGGTKDMPVQWHGVKLDDLTDHIISAVPDAQVVPLTESTPEEPADLRSMYAAQHQVAPKVRVKDFGYMLAFAMTDYKLQGTRQHAH